jgi:hypothetical protein
MKTSSKVIIAITVTLLLSFASVAVWASPSRQGTVPIIPVTGGTFNVNMLCNCTEDGLVTRIADPEKDISLAPAGFAYISDALKVELKGECDFEVCYPYPKEYEDQKAQIFKWDGVNSKWNIVESTIYGDPKQICTVDKKSSGDIYALISSAEITSLLSPSHVTLCNCSSDDKVTTLIDPAITVGAAPAGLEILTDATQVKCQEKCEVQVCFPYTAEEKAKDAQIYRWDETSKTWNLFSSTISEDPERICTLDEGSLGGIFTLIGK